MTSWNNPVIAKDVTDKQRWHQWNYLPSHNQGYLYINGWEFFWMGNGLKSASPTWRFEDRPEYYSEWYAQGGGW